MDKTTVSFPLGGVALIERVEKDFGVFSTIFEGIVVCDCWWAYDFLLQNAKLQRCRAHLLRRSAELESVAGRHLHTKLAELFEQIKTFNDNDNSKERTDNKARRQKSTGD